MWFVDDDAQHHMFFLYASRALQDPDARHYRASVGHATSRDLQHWTRVEDAIVRSDAPAFDDLATWTGSIVRAADGTWFMFYTGSTSAPAGKNVQSIGYATSADLMQWRKGPDNPVLVADPRWYETLPGSEWHDEAFRDPWVFADVDGDGWHMLITARSAAGPSDDRGVVGHAWSPDLTAWETLPPLTSPGNGFGQLEVLQVAEVGPRHVLLFSCLAEHASASVQATGTRGGIWSAPAAGPLGPFDIAAATQLTDDRYYAGRLVQRRGDDTWHLMAFRHTGEGGSFVGEISDPMPVRWEGERLAIPELRTASDVSLPRAVG